MKSIRFLTIVFALVITSRAWATITIDKDEETGIVTITQTTAGEIGPALRDAHLNLISAEDRAKVTSATGFVLVGPFNNDPDLMQLAQKNGSISSLDMSDCVISPNNLMIPGVWKTSLSSIDLPTDEDFNTLPSNFLYGFTLITDIDIPANVKTIQNGALGNTGLTEITIPATVTDIYEGAFKETISLRDVYAESRSTVCHMNAFDFNSLVGQTDIANFYTYAAKLHYPNTPEDYEYFVGAWKEGRTIDNGSLNGFKDGIYEWVQGVGSVKVGPNNGWQQFALSDNSEPMPMINNDVRTYSDNVEHDYLPTGNKYEIRVYRPVGYNKNGETSLRRVRSRDNKTNAVPAHTGVVLKVLIKENGKSYLTYFEHTNNNLPIYTWNWTGRNDDNANNLLETSVEPTEVHPVWPWPKSTVEYRNFGLTKKSGIYRWSRLTSSTMRENRAYLKMPATIFTNNNEGENEGPGIGGDINAPAKGTMFFGDEGVMNASTSTNDDEDNIQYVGLVFPDDDEEESDYQSEMHFLYANPEDCIPQSGIATKIENASVQSQDDFYYNLQGVIVFPKSKGIYIHRGKKFVIK
jgi:hypothetical protein